MDVERKQEGQRLEFDRLGNKTNDGRTESAATSKRGGERFSVPAYLTALTGRPSMGGTSPTLSPASFSFPFYHWAPQVMNSFRSI